MYTLVSHLVTDKHDVKRKVIAADLQNILFSSFPALLSIRQLHTKVRLLFRFTCCQVSRQSSAVASGQRERLSSSGVKKRETQLPSDCYSPRSRPEINKFLSAVPSALKNNNCKKKTCCFSLRGKRLCHCCFFFSHPLHRRQVLFTPTNNNTYNSFYFVHSLKTKTITMNSVTEKKYHQEEDTIGEENNDHMKSYEETVKALNSLQSLNRTIQDRKLYDLQKMVLMKKFVGYTGMTPEILNQLSVVHIAGTKGKGSTCSFVESILRHKGYKTGFFSSPHLKEVRERIRLNGAPISQEKFIKHFWHCFNLVKANCDDTLPTFFQFLTVLSLYVFWKEKVDVCILEVGIGGRYDATNIIQNPVVCGITHLGIDHTTILGNTIESIAGHKAGIFKPGTTAVTSPQLKEALDVLKENAKELKCSLYMAPRFSSYEDLHEDAEINGYEEIKQENLSLALQLSRVWLNNFNKDLNQRKWVDPFSGSTIPVLDPLIADADIVIPALKSTYWAGRLQTVKEKNITYYLDGAHTEDSIKSCSDWFKKKSAAEIKDLPSNTKVVKILYFNLTGERNPRTFFIHLKDCRFDFAIFSTNTCYNDVIIEDQNKIENKQDITANNQKAWLELHHKDPNYHHGGGDICNHQTLLPPCMQDSNDTMTECFGTIYEALVWCNKGCTDSFGCKKFVETKDIPSSLKEADHIQVLITGSVYLVGGVLTIFDFSV